MCHGAAQSDTKHVVVITVTPKVVPARYLGRQWETKLQDLEHLRVFGQAHLNEFSVVPIAKVAIDASGEPKSEEIVFANRSKHVTATLRALAKKAGRSAVSVSRSFEERHTRCSWSTA